MDFIHSRALSRPPVVALTLPLHTLQPTEAHAVGPEGESTCAPDADWSSASSSVHANVLSFIGESSLTAVAPERFVPPSVGYAVARVHEALVARALSMATRAVYLFLVLPPALRNYPRLVSRLLAFYYSVQPDAPSGHRLFFTFQAVPIFSDAADSSYADVAHDTTELLLAGLLPASAALSLELTLRLSRDSLTARLEFTARCGFAPVGSGASAVVQDQMVPLFQVPAETHIDSSSDADAGADPEDMSPHRPCAGSVVGGTFDHLHGGHLALLTITALSARNRVIVGVSGDALLKKKKLQNMIEAWPARAYRVARWLETVRLATRPCKDCRAVLLPYLTSSSGGESDSETDSESDSNDDLDLSLPAVTAERCAWREAWPPSGQRAWGLRAAAVDFYHYVDPRLRTRILTSVDGVPVPFGSHHCLMGILTSVDGVPVPFGPHRCRSCGWEGAALVELLDPYGPAGTCDAASAGVLVVSEETRGGGAAVNTERARILAERLAALEARGGASGTSTEYEASAEDEVARLKAHFAPLSTVVVALTGADARSRPAGRVAQAVDALTHAALKASAIFADVDSEASAEATPGKQPAAGDKQSSTAARDGLEAVEKVLAQHPNVRHDLCALAAAAFNPAYLSGLSGKAPAVSGKPTHKQKQPQRPWPKTPLGRALMAVLGAFGIGSVRFEAAADALSAARADATAADVRAAERSGSSEADADLDRGVVPAGLLKRLRPRGSALTHLHDLHEAALSAESLAYSV